ncbi:MAG: hypothetical protein IJP88_10000 [Synergistaceae bacterium]|nr:hypothetical protein [Synergistaceae bacterium]
MTNEKVLRASKIGHPCDRNIWYSINGAEEITSVQSNRILELGKLLEPTIINWLRNDGWKVRRNPIDNSNDGMALNIRINGGIISAHPDCLISHDDGEMILADIKTMNDRAFRSLKREGTLKAFSNYADQLTVYAEALFNSQIQINKLAIVALNKNNCDGYIDVFDFQPERYIELQKRAEYLFACNDAPDKGDKFQDWCCGYCGFNHICEFAKKDTAVGDVNIPTTNNQNIFDAIELLKEARELSKAGKELEDEAKKVLDVEVRQQNIKSVRAGDIVLVLNEITSARFDTAAFKKLHPDMVNDFMKTSTSVRYEIKNFQEVA